MTRLFSGVIALAIALAASNVSAGEEHHRVRENGLVRFKASVSGITRVSVLGDRIASIVNDDQASLYQVKNDKNTGDIFLRYVGPEEMPAKEGGYLVTEGNRTLAFEILPIKASTQTVLITLEGVDSTSNTVSRDGGFAESGLGAGDGLIAQLTEATRSTIQKGIHKPYPTRGKNGALISRHRVGDLIGEVRVAAAGKDARQVREQEFYKANVLAVWVQKASLASGERSWVVVVRKK
ncbi:type-F conjugative transfer system secretin TraK [Shimia sp. FJ5]|uniref:TraK domain-containing protein n=1 Tax=Shimia sp. FJ5 TaxID=3079054 RepID=UPI00293DDDEF|nr:type-F conjugative transfer system secretin TraK [Shimia sp. FJ5]MDV4146438.1 type-F conjugative transfer system secretin TraK [Shimia sp. FJ5]